MRWERENWSTLRKMSRSRIDRLIKLFDFEPKLRNFSQTNRQQRKLPIISDQGCAEPIGMESKAIPDSQITASSEWDQKLSGAQARLHSKSGSLLGGWVAFTNNLHQWLQVDLGSYTTVTRVATQGRFKHNQWVTKYSLEYSDDADIFHVFKPEGANIPKVLKLVLWCFLRLGHDMSISTSSIYRNVVLLNEICLPNKWF